MALAFLGATRSHSRFSGRVVVRDGERVVLCCQSLERSGLTLDASKQGRNDDEPLVTSIVCSLHDIMVCRSTIARRTKIARNVC